jgi:hypothetical protein
MDKRKGIAAATRRTARIMNRPRSSGVALDSIVAVRRWELVDVQRRQWRVYGKAGCMN